AINAMKRGKHVYCEKPLAHSIYEVRQMMKAAQENNVVTQMGNQGHSFETIRMFCEWIHDGAIGNVHTIHAGCNSPNSALGQLSKLGEKHAVPAEVDWNLWLGPAQFRPYNPMYMPGRWRAWMPFGTGTLGDWTCHVVDPVFWALDLGAPTTIQAEAEDYDPKRHADTFPRRTKVKYQFPAKGNRGPITMYWYSGYDTLPRPENLEPDRKVTDIGAIVLGDKGSIMYGSHGAGGLRIFPETQMKAYKQPPKTLPRVKSHHQDWVNAIRNGTRSGSDFSYGGPLTEIALLGIIATRMLGQELKWDGQSIRFTNNEQANRFVKPVFRAGWEI
ncbi:MAG TPA: Gfo/Idh/MocA family oxidoreductase, partial [Tepidisphaeraceae bacterium]|nr:Gfo/Idh/MocA family oxidoreductase [Tepidisphaeraceae bacterium]